VVPFAPGGSNTTLAHLLEIGLSETWDQPVVVIFKPGAGSVLGTDFVSKSAPDGYTIGVVTTAHIINPSLRRSLPFDTLKDLAGVSMIATSPLLISATNALPANNIKELITLSKNQPGKLSYASAGIGTAMNMGGELLKSLTGSDILHVPYNRAGDAYNDVFSGRVQLHIGTIFGSLPHIKSGNMKPIALMSNRRSNLLPEISTVAETLPGFQVESIYGAVVPSTTPREIINKISADFAKVLNSSSIRQRLTESGLVPIGNKPEEFDAYIRAEIPKWAKVVKASGATAD
jgi:tripartite-type tricarboxylate transporter receptor subunit TctC